MISFAIHGKSSIIPIIEIFENSERGYVMGYTVAVVGATGAVGAQMIKDVGRINTSN